MDKYVTSGHHRGYTDMSATSRHHLVLGHDEKFYL